jgi:hypothetical protein
MSFICLPTFTGIYNTGLPTAGPWSVALLNDVRASFSCTINTGTDIITTSAAHGYVNTQRVVVQTTGTMPTSTPQITNTGVYYVKNSGSPTATDFQVSATPGGAAINFTAGGTGVLSISDVALDQLTQSAPLSAGEIISKELSSGAYQGLTVRPTATVPAFTLNTSNPRNQTTATAVIDNSAGTGDITFNAAVLILGGSTTIGNTTGDGVAIQTFHTPQVVPAGQSLTLQMIMRFGN